MIKRSEKTGEHKNRNGRTISAGARKEPKATTDSPPKKAGDQSPASKVNDAFRKFAHKTSELVGSAWSFIIAAAVLIIWAVCGPASGYSNTWQLIINTATTIVTFLMVFLIQNTQNRDAKAIHLKLDELIHALKGARNKLINLEELSDEELKEIEEHFKRVKKVAQRAALEPDPRPDDQNSEK